ncbi:hypothetical protein [Hyphomicrobium sp. 2TAF46]|uniref:hypothetical protein n=1 Tax=Hyphomicrobium sp. 2TAF46 TaxID=3233019 RepID=UPI003F8DAE9D
MPTMAADSYRELSDAEIKSKITGMEISEAHFSEQYLADGTVRIVSLGRRILGKWKIERGQLCIKAPNPEDSRCKEVWTSGKKYQLRFPGDPVPFDVDIQKMQPRGW